VHRGRVLPRKFEKFNNREKPSPRSNPVIMHRTIKIILPKIREIASSSMGVLTPGGTIYMAPYSQPKNQGSQTIVNFRRTRRFVFKSQFQIWHGLNLRRGRVSNYEKNKKIKSSIHSKKRLVKQPYSSTTSIHTKFSR